jgi:hypothetical protein
VVEILLHHGLRAERRHLLLELVDAAAAPVVVDADIGDLLQLELVDEDLGEGLGEERVGLGRAEEPLVALLRQVAEETPVTSGIL